MGFFDKLKHMITGKKNEVSDHSYTTHYDDPRLNHEERKNSENSL